jgi:hypothetical protein
VVTAADSLNVTTKYATPTTLPFAHERDTHRHTPLGSRWSFGLRSLLLAAAAIVLVVLLSLWLQTAPRREHAAQPPLVAPATTDLGAATKQPSTPDFAEHQEPGPDIDALPRGELPESYVPARQLTKPQKHPATSVKPPTPAASRTPQPANEPVQKPTVTKKPKPAALEAESDDDALGGRL